MAPLVPDIISNEFNFIIAIIVGIGFGFALEQGGFSSTRKLAGLFYGYDFTVLRVFFTAGITAMTGVLILGHAGLLNLNVIYINPTFLWSAIVGGLIMGGGFIMGGFCPGTSICSAAVGRIDAFVFVGGSILGILVFMEIFPVLEPLFVAKNMGSPTVPVLLGISPEAFGMALAIIAVVAFYFTSKIEDYVNGVKPVISNRKKVLYSSAAALPVLLILLVWITPSKKEYVWETVEKRAQSDQVVLNKMDVDQLAFELIHHAQNYNVIDVRDTASFKETIPMAVNIPLAEMDKQAWRYIYQQPYKKNIFIGNSPEDVRKAAILANILGDEDPIILDASINDFRNTIFAPVDPGTTALKSEMDAYRFRQEAKIQLTRIEERLKNLKQPVKKEIKKIQGGCV